MKSNSTMSDQAIIEVVKAHAEGRTIQCMPREYTKQGTWRDLSHSGVAWNFQNNRYRVKPERWANLYVNNEVYVNDGGWQSLRGYVYPSKEAADKAANMLHRLACVKLPDEDMS